MFNLPFKMTTSSSFLIGKALTLCLVLNSLDKVTLINLYLKWDGAVKWAFVINISLIMEIRIYCFYFSLFSSGTAYF